MVYFTSAGIQNISRKVQRRGGNYGRSKSRKTKIDSYGEEGLLKGYMAGCAVEYIVQPLYKEF